MNELLAQAREFLQRGSYERAEELAHDVIRRVNGGDDKQSLVHAKRILGVAASFRGQYDTALDHLGSALTIANKLGDVSAEALIANNIGNVHKELASYDVALASYNRALTLYSELNDKTQIASVTGNIGNIYINLGDYVTSLEYFRKALSCHLELDRKPSIANILGNIGVLYLNLGEYSQALDYSVRSLKIYEEINERSGITRLIGNIGIIYKEIGDYQKSLEYYHRALTAHQDLGERSGVARVTGNIGIVHESLQDYERAIEFYHRALALYEELGEKSGVALVTSHIGGVFYNQKDYDKALSYYFRALATHEELGERSGVAIVLGNIGSVYAYGFTLDDDNKAEEYLRRAISMTDELGMKGELSQNHRVIAEYYEKNSQWEKFAAHYKIHHQLTIEVQNEEVKKQADRFGWERKIAEVERQLEHDRINAEREKRELQHRFELQAREVEYMIHELVNKNSFLDEVRKDVKKLSKHTRGEGNDLVERLIDRLERSIVPLDRKVELEKQWTEVHGSFMAELKKAYPELTSMELKIAALLTMKLSSSHISSILFLSKRTVEFHRLNMRKKLKLNQGDDIYVTLSKYTTVVTPST